MGERKLYVYWDEDDIFISTKELISYDAVTLDEAFNEDFFGLNYENGTTYIFSDCRITYEDVDS